MEQDWLLSFHPWELNFLQNCGALFTCTKRFGIYGIQVREDVKKKAFIRDPYVGFMLQVMATGPHNFPCCFGLVPLPFHQVSGYPLSRKSYLFQWVTPIFTPIFPVLVLFTPIFAVLMLWATLLTPSFCSHNDETVFKMQWLWQAATTKNWFPSINLSFGPYLQLCSKRFYKYKQRCQNSRN